MILSSCLREQIPLQVVGLIRELAILRRKHPDADADSAGRERAP